MGKFAKGMKKMGDKTVFSAFLETYIPAGRAMPAPPLGPQLGQVIASVVQLKNTYYYSFLGYRPAVNSITLSLELNLRLDV